MEIFSKAKKEWLPQNRFLLIASLAFLFVNSCKYDHFNKDLLSTNITYEGDWAIPLAHSVLTVDDILDRFDDDDIIQIDSTGMLALVYYSNIFSIAAQDLLVLPAQNINTSFSLTAPQITALQTSGSFTAPFPISECPLGIPESG